MIRTLITTAALSLAASTTLADGITVQNPYARVASRSAVTGAAFMMLRNDTDIDDLFVAARGADIAERVEIHTHLEDENGVMRMREVEGGVPVPAHGSVALERGGLHVMFLGLTRPLEQGDEIALTLVFEHAGEIDVTVPVDLTRDAHGSGVQHGMAQGAGAHSGDHSGKMQDGLVHKGTAHSGD